MWPKALLELLPHLTRLVPLVNRYFASKGAEEDATRAALERKLGETAAALRVDIQRGADASVGACEALQAQLSKQTAVLNEVAAGVAALKASDEALQARLAKLEERKQPNGLLYAIAFLQVVVCVLIVILFVRLHQ